MEEIKIIVTGGVETVYLDKQWRGLLWESARDTGKSRNQIIREALVEYLLKLKRD